jgi:group I intron endonuclease
MFTIFSNYSNKAGIYGFYNHVTDKIFIGSALNLNKRLKRHFNNSIKSTNRNLYYDIRKYGYLNFRFSLFVIIKNTEEITRKKLLQIETHYLQSLPK